MCTLQYSGFVPVIQVDASDLHAGDGTQTEQSSGMSSAFVGK
jgi:hypothetical protein